MLYHATKNIDLIQNFLIFGNNLQVTVSALTILIISVAKITPVKHVE